MRQIEVPRWWVRGVACVMLVIPGLASAQPITSEPLAAPVTPQVNLATPGLSGAAGMPTPLAPRVTLPSASQSFARPVVPARPVAPALPPAPLPSVSPAMAPAMAPPAMPTSLAPAGASLLGHSAPGQSGETAPGIGAASLLPPSLSAARHAEAVSHPRKTTAVSRAHRPAEHRTAIDKTKTKARSKVASHKVPGHTIAKARTRAAKPPSPAAG